MSETILMTGATGFVGSHLARALVADGYNITIISRSASNTSRIRNILDHVRRIDLDKTHLLDALSKLQIAGVIHLATDYGRRNSSAAEVFQTNLVLPVTLFEALTKLGARFFINTDSFFCKPQFNYRVMRNYIFSKNSFREWARNNTEQIHFANLRLEHVYGPDDGQEKFVSSVLKQMLNPSIRDIPFTLGIQRRDFVYVDDVVEAYRCVLTALQDANALPSYSTFEVGLGSSTQVKQFAEKLHEITGSQAQLSFGALAYQDGEIMDSFADLRSITQLGYAPRVGLNEGIIGVVDAARKALLENIH
jgi:CDP-paratose synthetase